MSDDSEGESNASKTEEVEDGGDAHEKFFPCEGFRTIPAHIKPIQALAFHPSGARMATGASDSVIKLWDFNGMRSDIRPFREFVPAERHEITAISYSSTGSHFVASCGDAICRIFDAEGQPVQETVRGDMYIKDPAKTLGHTHTVLDVEWHPFERNLFLSASLDATVRVFDLTSKPTGIDQALAHQKIFKAVDKRGSTMATSVHIATAHWAPITAAYILGGCSDGSLQVWSQNKQHNRPDLVFKGAHESAVTSLAIFSDENRLISRSQDTTMKLWDKRQIKAPVHSWAALESDAAKPHVILTGDGNVIVTTCNSEIRAFSSTTYAQIGAIELGLDETRVPGNAVSENPPKQRKLWAETITWSSPLRQLTVGCSDGTVRMFYNRKFSKKGALLIPEGLQFKPKTASQDVYYSAAAPVYNMEELPAGYKETRSGDIRTSRKLQREARLKELRPGPAPNSVPPKEAQTRRVNPMTRITCATTANSNVEPVEAIKAFAKVAAEEPIFVQPAYKKTQPVPLYDETPIDAAEALMSRAKKCPRCGLKMCQCGYMQSQGGAKYQRT